MSRIAKQLVILFVGLTNLIVFQNCSQGSFSSVAVSSSTISASSNSSSFATQSPGVTNRLIPTLAIPQVNPVALSTGLISSPSLMQVEQTALIAKKDCVFNLKKISTEYKSVELFTTFYTLNNKTYQPDAVGSMTLPYDMPLGVQVALANKATANLTDVIFWVNCDKGNLVIKPTAANQATAVVASQGQTAASDVVVAENPFYTCSIEKRIADCKTLFDGFALQNPIWKSMNPQLSDACNASAKVQAGWRADFFTEQAEYNSNIKLSGYGCAVEFKTNLCKRGTNIKVTKQEWLDYYRANGYFTTTDPTIREHNLQASLDNQFNYFQARMSWYTSRVADDPQQCQPEGLKYYEYWYNTNQNIQPTLSVTRVNTNEGKVGTKTTVTFETNMSDAKVMSYECAPPAGRSGFNSNGRQELALVNGRRVIEGLVDAAWVGLSDCHYEVTGSLGTATFSDKLTFIP